MNCTMAGALLSISLLVVGICQITVTAAFSIPSSYKSTDAPCGKPAINPILPVYTDQSGRDVIVPLGNLTNQRSANTAGGGPGSPYIIGGTTAVAHSWPWMAAIMTDDRVTCGGTMLDENWVLTAAHCVVPSIISGKLSIKLGVVDVEKSDENSDQMFKIATRVIHDNFNPTTYVNDIALVKLDKPATINDYVSPVCLPSSSDLPAADTEGIVTGWGYISEFGPSSNLLQQVKVPALSREDCVKDHSPDVISPTMFCAGYTDGGKDACHADSGGPFQVSDEATGVWTQMGIVDWGTGCAEPNSPGVYTGVGPFIDWIKEHIASE